MSRGLGDVYKRQIIAYAIAKEMEIKTIKIILTCKLNGFDNGFIRERMREMYV